MMSPEDREAELVRTMLEDRSRFHAEYRRLAGLASDSSLFHICDRDIIREILSMEYSDEFSFDR